MYNERVLEMEIGEYMTPTLDKNCFSIVESAFKGKRLEKFQNSLRILVESLEAGSWIKGGSRSCDSGFYQGIEKNAGYFKKDYDDKNAPAQDSAWALMMSLQYGKSYKGTLSIGDAFHILKKQLKNNHSNRAPKISVTEEQVEAWVQLCNEKATAIEWLNSARPIPVITDMGASPKVLRTLDEMNLALTASSLKFPKLERREKPYKYINVYTGEEETGKHVYYVTIWEKGIKHGQSRFSGFAPSGHCRCDACGKSIPSGMLVPLEGKDNRGQWMSMFVGTDCAKSLFGVKDIGIDMNVDQSIEEAKNKAIHRREAYMKRTGRK